MEQDFGALSPLFKERRYSDDSIDEESPLIDPRLLRREGKALWYNAASKEQASGLPLSVNGGLMHLPHKQGRGHGRADSMVKELQRSEKKRRVVEVALVVCLVCINTSRRLVFKVMEERMINYPFVLCMVTTSAFLPFYFLFFLFKRLIWRRVKRKRRKAMEKADADKESPDRVDNDEVRGRVKEGGGGSTRRRRSSDSADGESNMAAAGKSSRYSVASSPSRATLYNGISQYGVEGEKGRKKKEDAKKRVQRPAVFHYFVLALLDAMQTLLYIYGGLYTSGAQQQVLPLSAVLLTALFLYMNGRCCGRAKNLAPTDDFRYRLSFCLRCIAFIMLGCSLLLSLLPPFLSPFGPEALSATLFLLSGLPASLSALYRAKFLRKARVIELNLSTGLLQLLFLIALSPITPKLDLEERVISSEIPTNILNGFVCWLVGTNAWSGDTCGSPDTPAGIVPGLADMISGSLSVYLYLILSGVMNLLVFALQLQPGRKVRRVITLTTVISLPLSVGLFGIMPVMGRFTSFASSFDIAATVLSVAGLIFARSGEAARPSYAPKKKPKTLRPSFDEMFQRASAQYQKEQVVSDTEIPSEVDGLPAKWKRYRGIE
mmetsp:Transcript_17881/g.44336  ORF Transcript_17881/g.44336 Transcript_17881/m.44336 type:complete len:604 (-) Transcript_17881:443-2254(-)